MEPITDIVIHLSGPEVQKISTTRFIRIKEADGLDSEHRLLLAIKALHDLLDRYKADEVNKGK